MASLLGFAAYFACFSTVYAQNGKLFGRVIDKDSKEAVAFAGIKLFSGGALKGGASADFDGNFSVSPVTPGTYTVEVLGIGYAKEVITNVKIGFEETRKLNVELTSSAKTTEEVVVKAYKEPIIGVDNGEKVSLSAEQIAKIPTRNVNSMVATQANVYSADDNNQVNIKGMRTTDNAVFINGIRQFGTSLPPAEAIEELSIVAGGIPAQYGDALGGIISITTKSAAQKLSFGVQGETSSLFDKWHYNFVGLNGSGPIFKRKEILPDGKVGGERTLLGFFGALQFTSNADADPSALPIYRATDQALEQIRQRPLTRFGESYTSTTNFFGNEQFQRISARPNVGSTFLQSNFNLDFQPKDNIMLTLGGNYNFNETRIGPNEDNGGTNPDPNSYQNLFNFGNNGTTLDQNYNAFLRFRQTFNTGIEDTGSLLKNVYYQVQLDYVRRNLTSFDPRFGKRLNEYNYVGKFGIETADQIRVQEAGPARLVFKGRNEQGVEFTKDTFFVPTSQNVVLLKDRPRQIIFSPGGINSDLERINQQIFSENVIVNDFQLFNFGGFLNGPTGGGINDFGYFYPALGKSQTNYSRSRDEQYRFSFQAAAEIKNHTIKIGGEFEQRVIRDFNTSGSLYGRGRILLNSHLSTGFQGENIKVEKSIYNGGPNDPNNGKELLTVITSPYVNTTLLPGGGGRLLTQSQFDFNFRRRNGIPIDRSIFIDEFAPNSFSLRDFGVSEIINNGVNNITAWSGYTPYGDIAKRTSFFDFFTDTINRPIDAFRPLYYAGFIEDRFQIGDLILRLGLRVDAFDVNMPVLKDKYSLTNLTRAGDFYNRSGKVRPGGVGDGWAVYVDKSPNIFNGTNFNEFKVLGFRNGDTWYDANGIETSNPAIVEFNGSVNPFFDATKISDPNLKSLQSVNGVTLDAFEDFKPQINVLPRISFSFPISEQALFYAHYDILTQRPLGVNANNTLQQNYATGFDYFSLLAQNGGFMNNPNLKPQKKIDYALGFQQAINESSALKLSVFYSEVKDLIQVINVNYAYPIRYQTSGNQDFSVVKGISLQYDLRKTKNFTVQASYTLSFAEGSASNFAGALLNTSTPNLRNTTPLNFDQRHAFKLNFDYRFGDGEGPTFFGMKPFSDMGFNMTNYAGSGTPYTQDGSPWGGRYQVKGAINGSRLPWNNRTSIRVDKSFSLKREGSAREHFINVYFYVQNVFNAQNVLSVYARTGSPTDSGFLTSQFGQNQTNLAFSPESYAMFYNMAIMNPDNISLPRRFRLGVSYNF